jgi:hypothetical protein
MDFGVLGAIIILYFIGKAIIGTFREQERPGRQLFDIKIDLVVLVVIFMLVLLGT